MYFYFFIILILLLAAIFSNTETWSPFQSEKVREICIHMTKSEKQAAIKRSIHWGLFIGLIPAAAGIVLGLIVLQSALLGVTACGLVFPVVGFFFWRKWWPYLYRSQQSFLASTKWAKDNNIKAEDINLYSYPKKK